MPQHPAPGPPRPDSPTVPYLDRPVHSPHPALPPGQVAEVVPARPRAELTINKILAGAGAAATTAVLGSYFGAAGTVAGAALGSVASTVATTIYQRSLDRTRETLVARIRPASGAPTAEADATVQLRVEPAVPPGRPRRHWAVWVGATVLVFLLGLLAVTGIEWIKGSTITAGDSGTSVGRVLGTDPGTPAPTEAPSPSTSETTGTATSEQRSSTDPSSTPSSSDPGADTRRSSTKTTTSPTSATLPVLPGQG